MTILYGSSIADATLTTANQMATTTGGTETSKTTTITLSHPFAEILSQGGSSLAVTALPTPTGHGWVYRPGAGTFAAGNWSAITTTSDLSGNSVTYTIRFYKLSGGTYTSIGTIALAVATHTKTTHSFASTSMGAATLGASDALYVDYWIQDTSNANGDNPTFYESTSASVGVANEMQVTTASFTATTNPVLATSPTTLSFSATVGGASPATQNDTLSETAGVGTAWTSSISYGSGSGWLGISPSSGTLSASGTQTVVYTCTTGALAVGTYTATVTYTATTGGATATVAVTFVVNATPPALSTSPTTLSFSATVGGSSPATQNDTLTNTGGTSSAWTSAIAYGSGSGWLGIVASSGTLAGGANATIVFTCTTGALAAGTYTATVTFTATTGGATATVAVTFVINNAAITYSNYKLTIEPQLVAALNANHLLNSVQLLGPDTTMANDSWLTSASNDLKSTLSGYVRHAFPTGASDISNDSRETTVRTLVAGIYANDPTAKPIIQGEMGFAAQGPGQSVTLFQYGVEMTDFAVQLARSGMAALIGYILDDDMHGVQWGMWQISDSSSTPRPWAWIWALLTNTLVPGSQLYAPAQPTSNDFRFLAAQSPQGAWTFVLVNRKALAQNIQIIVPFAPVASTSMQSYVYSNATPLLLDGNGFALASGAVTGVLSRGFTVPIAANSVLVLSQATAPQNTIYDVKRPPLQRRR